MDREAWRIVAIGDDGTRYLIDTGIPWTGSSNMGRVLSLTQGKLFPGGLSVGTIADRGGWVDYTGPQDILDQLIAHVEVLERPPRSGDDTP